MICVTHSDLDGAGCAIIAKLFYGDRLENIESHSYKTAVQRLLKLAKGNKRFFFTDISVPVDDLTEILKSESFMFGVDHHTTSKIEHMHPKYIWNDKYCGSSLLYKYLLGNKSMDTSGNFDNFIKAIEAFDIWLLDSPYRKFGEHLNLLNSFVGWDIFVGRFAKSNGVLEKDLKDLLPWLISRHNYEVQKAIKDTVILTFNNFKVGFLYRSQNISTVTEVLKNQFPDVDIFIIIDTDQQSVSLRNGKALSEDVDLSKLAEKAGGGGHKHAAGFLIKKEFHRLMEDVVAKVFL